MLRLAEELLLLLLDETRGEFSNVPDRILGYALAGAALMDLSLEDRIDSDPSALILLDAAPTGDGLLDPILADIETVAASRPNLPADFWVRRVAGRAYELRGRGPGPAGGAGHPGHGRRRGHLLADPAGVAHPALSGGGRKQEREIRDRIMGVLYTDDVSTPAEVCIVSLAHACGAFERILTPSEYAELRERIELVARLDLIGQSVAGAVRKVSVAYREELRQRIQRAGGGWPLASGRLPLLGHALMLMGRDLRAYLTEQYRRHGPIFEVRAPGRKLVVLAGRDANLFMIREGKTPPALLGAVVRVRLRGGHAARVITGLDGADHFQLRRALKTGYSRKFFSVPDPPGGRGGGPGARGVGAGDGGRRAGPDAAGVDGPDLPPGGRERRRGSTSTMRTGS